MNSGSNLMMTRNDNIACRVFSTIFALSPVLGIYAVPGIPALSASQVLLVAFISWWTLKRGLPRCCFFKAYIGYAVMVSLVNAVVMNYDAGAMAYNLCSQVLAIAFLCYAVEYIDYAILNKWYLRLAYFAAAFFIAQWTLGLIGVHIVGILPLPLSLGVDSDEFINLLDKRERLSSLFSEPAHYAAFMATALTLILMQCRNFGWRLWMVIVMTATVIMCESTCGAVMIAIAWAAWILKRVETSRYRPVAIVLAALVLVAGVAVSLGTEYMDYIIRRFTEMSASSKHGTSGYSSYIRVVRGYIPIMESNVWEQCFGHGLSSFTEYVQEHPETKFLSVTHYNVEWVNVFQFVWYSTGIVGVVLLFRQIYWFYHRTTYVGKVLICEMVANFFASGGFIDVMVLTIAYFNKKTKQACKE